MSAKKTIPERPCSVCGTLLERRMWATGPEAYGSFIIRMTCSDECSSKRKSSFAEKPGFTKGFVPWNKDRKGIHLSPSSEFKKGQRPVSWVPVGTVRVRHFNRSRDRAFVKIDEPNVWKLRAIVVWESVNGPLAKGFLIHHIDRNELNDDITNLQAMTRAEHLNEHRHEFNRNRINALVRAGRKRLSKRLGKPA